MSVTHLSPIVGIDLGTTNSLIALFHEGRAHVIPNERGDRLIPSVVAIDEGGVALVGGPARARIGHDPTAGAARFKSDMGTDRSFPLPDRARTPIELSAIVLRELADAASARLRRPVHRAVITVPAYFQEPQRAATRQAAELAGLQVVRMLNEPTAAAIAYGLRDSETERRAIVIDLGGGTFDVTVLDIFEGVIEVVASTGDSRLGGEDFTDALAYHVARQLELDLDALEPHPRATLRGACERAKRQLASSDSAMIRLPDFEGAPWDPHTVESISRAQFALLNKVRTDRLERIVRDALVQAELTYDEVDEVVLVGGATRMPIVHDLAARLFPVEAHARLDPDQVVAMGAAIQGAMIEQGGALDDMVVTDVVPFTLGVRIARQAFGTMLDDYFLPVIHRNTTIPVSSRTTVSTVHPLQTAVKVEVYQGEHRRTTDNRLLGAFSIEGIPELPFDKDSEHLPTQPIELTFTHDVNGLLEVEAKVLNTGELASVLIESAPGRMTDAEREVALAGMAALKRHPRELLPNRHLLEEARRVYADYDIDRQRTLDAYLFAFEAALEARDARAIEQTSAHLRDTLRALGRP